MSIRLRFLAWFAVCLVFVSVGIGAIAYRASNTVATGNFRHMAMAQLQRVDERINSFLAPGIMASEYLAQTDLIKYSRGKLTSYVGTTERTTLYFRNAPLYEQRVYNQFMTARQYNYNFDLIFMANSDGEYAQAPEGRYKDAGYDPRKRSWYRQLMASSDQTVISSPYLTTGAEIVTSIMTKTTDPDGRPLGMVGVDYTLTSLTADLAEQRILKTGYLVIFCPTGKILVDGQHADNIGKTPEEIAQALGQPDSSAELRVRLRASPDGEQYGVGRRGKSEYAVTHTMPKLGWKLAVIFDQNELMESSRTVLTRMVLWSIPLMVLTLILMSYLIYRISEPLRGMATICSRIANGDITNDVPEAYRQRRDEVGLLAVSLQEMVDSSRSELHVASALARGDYTQSLPPRSEHDLLGRAFDDMVKMNYAFLEQLIALVGTVNQGADLVSGASRSLSSGSETTASALEEISTTLAEIDSQAKETARYAGEATTAAVNSREAAERGYHGMTVMTSGMARIQEAGEKIGFVVKLIDDIAFQTNLLSLNAAVEAARAGRHGKGFSVVAEEVRQLASRSAKAANETGGMVQAMVSEMREGVLQAERSDKEFREIVEMVNQVVRLFDNIATAAANQSGAISQIVSSLGQVDIVTRNNSANAEELAESATSLTRQAEKLRSIVSRFQLHSDGWTPQSPARPGTAAGLLPHTGSATRR